MILVWWVYVLIVVGLFVSFLIGHIILRKINASRQEERLESRHEGITVSAQTSLVLEKNTKRVDSKNLKEDKRTSKSLSLVFGKDKSLAHTNLQELITDDSHVKRLHDKGRKSDPSTNIEKELSSFTTAFSATSSNKEWGKLCMPDIPNSDLRLIKNVSSTKGDVSYGKSDELIKCKDSINDVLPPPVTHNKSVHNNRELFTPKESHTWSMKFDKKAHENVKAVRITDDSTEHILPLQDNITTHNNDNKEPTPKESIDDILKSVMNSKIKGFLTYIAPHKDVPSLPTKNEKTIGEKLQEFITTDDSTGYTLLTVQNDKSLHSNKDLLKPYDSHKEPSLHSNKDLLTPYDSHKEPTDKESIDYNNTQKIILPSPEDDTPYDSHKEPTDKESIEYNNTQKIILPSPEDDTPYDSHKEPTDNESIEYNNTQKIILLSPEDDTTITLADLEFIAPKDSHKILKPALKNNEDSDKSNKQFIITTDSKGLLSSFKVDKHDSEFIKAKDSVLKMLKCDENMNQNFEEIHRNKADVNVVFSSLTDNKAKDESNEITSKIAKEPSSLFFTTLNCTPCTPKEMFEPYERALASGKSSKSNTNLQITESKHAIGVSSFTSRSKSICDIKRSKDNVTISVSRVIFNPETKTSYIQVLEDPIVSKPETGIAKMSRTNSKLNEMAQIKDNVSKSTSRVTFAKNEIVISDNASMVDHVCVVTPPTVALVNDCDTIGSNEFDIESASNESTTDSKDETKENTSSTFKRNFINESVVVTHSFYRSCKNETLGNVTKYDYDLEASRSSYDSPSGMQTDKELVGPVGSFSTKLLECLSAVVKGEASTSRSRSATAMTKNEASSSGNDYPEIVIIKNKFSGDAECSNRTEDKIEENVDELKKRVLETKSKLDALSLTRLDLKLEQDATKTDTGKQNEDEREENEK